MTGGHIRERGRASYELRYTINGKTATETVRTSSKRVAQQRLRELLSAVDQGAKTAPSRDTCSAWFVGWLSSLDEGLSPMTALLYRRKVASHLSPMFGHIRLRDLDVTQVRSAFAGLNLARSTKTTLRRILSASLSQAVEDGKLRYNPLLGRREKHAVDRVRREQAVLTPAEIGRLWTCSASMTCSLPSPLRSVLGPAVAKSRR
jgi:hypothetical protein